MGLFDFFKKKEQQKPKVNISFSAHEYTPGELKQQQEAKVSEIRELVRNSFPSNNGLLPHEIFMLSKATHYKTEETSFPQFWHYDFGVENPQALLKMLLNRGFIRVATAKESVDGLTVAELKELLSGYGIKAAGKKADLISSVQDGIREDDLAQAITSRRYALTELGEQELKENEYVTYFGSAIKYGLTLWDMNKMLQNYPNNLYLDRIWANLNQQMQHSANELQKDGNMYAFYLREISIRYEMCDFLIEEEKHLQDALKLWAMAFYYDLLVKSTAEFQMMLELEKYKNEPAMKRVKDPRTGENALIENKNPPQFIEKLNLPFKLRDVSVLKERLSLSDEQLAQALVSCFGECQEVQYDYIGNRNITRLNLTYEDIAGLVVAGLNKEEDIVYTICQSIEGTIKSGGR